MCNITSYKQCVFRVRFMIILVIVGLVGSGLTTIPLIWELNLLNDWLATAPRASFLGEVADFIRYVRMGVLFNHQQYPFMLYGLDWLGFAHFAIALVFFGPLKDPTKNDWVVEWGILVCLFCIPAILLFGYVRGMPLYWSVLDSCFAIIALVPLCVARKNIKEMVGVDGLLYKKGDNYEVIK